MTRIRAAGGSDAGAVREINEDAWLFVADDGEALAVVADGMGGSSGGRPAEDGNEHGGNIVRTRTGDYNLRHGGSGDASILFRRCRSLRDESRKYPHVS